MFQLWVVQRFTYVLHCTNKQSLISQLLQNSPFLQLWRKREISGKNPYRWKTKTHWFFFFFIWQKTLHLSNNHKLLGDGHVSLKLTLAHTLEWLSTMSRSWEWTCNRGQAIKSLNKRNIWPIKSGGHKMLSQKKYGMTRHIHARSCIEVLQCVQYVYSLLWQTAGPQLRGTGAHKGGPPQGETARWQLEFAYGPASAPELSSILSNGSGLLKKKRD